LLTIAPATKRIGEMPPLPVFGFQGNKTKVFLNRFYQRIVKGSSIVGEILFKILVKAEAQKIQLLAKPRFG
jgi:hypothetical protein